LTIGSLFSGIGGLEMGLEMCGLGPVVWQCDSDSYARAVLARHWPTVKRYDDVRAIDGTATRVDVVCGGFPCQDISNAGKRAGITGERSGLWFEFARVIRLLRPRIVFVENVAALANRGLDAVLGSLAEMGLDAEWGVFSAAEAGAPHRRDRLFILAYSHGNSGQSRWTGDAGEGQGGRDADRGGERATVADADRAGLAVGPQQSTREEQPSPERGSPALAHASVVRGEPVRRVKQRSGRESSRHVHHWSAEPDVGRVAHGVPARTHRLRLLGNAVVPQQAALAFRALTERVKGVPAA
jgi:DNA (cytosine-5)-methyltransferase 1